MLFVGLGKQLVHRAYGLCQLRPSVFQFGTRIRIVQCDEGIAGFDPIGVIGVIGVIGGDGGDRALDLRSQPDVVAGHIRVVGRGIELAIAK